MTPKNSSNDQQKSIFIIKGGPSKFDLMFALFDDRFPKSDKPYGRALIFHTLQQLPAKTSEYTTYREYENVMVSFNLFKIERNKDDPEAWTLWGIWPNVWDEASVRIVYRTDKREGAIFKE